MGGRNLSWREVSFLRRSLATQMATGTGMHTPVSCNIVNA